MVAELAASASERCAVSDVRRRSGKLVCNRHLCLVRDMQTRCSSKLQQKPRKTAPNASSGVYSEAVHSCAVLHHEKQLNLPETPHQCIACSFKCLNSCTRANKESAMQQRCCNVMRWSLCCICLCCCQKIRQFLQSKHQEGLMTTHKWLVHVAGCTMLPLGKQASIAVSCWHAPPRTGRARGESCKLNHNGHEGPVCEPFEPLDVHGNSRSHDHSMHSTGCTTAFTNSSPNCVRLWTAASPLMRAHPVREHAITRCCAFW